MEGDPGGLSLKLDRTSYFFVVLKVQNLKRNRKYVKKYVLCDHYRAGYFTGKIVLCIFYPYYFVLAYFVPIFQGFCLRV